mmetsp:Transcript_15785/g.42437  ORF Transcript_15785/g.42437 Transcript_15785/m.42437 type:complete len:211 (+) Transcript_15785:205-837(+)
MTRSTAARPTAHVRRLGTRAQMRPSLVDMRALSARPHPLASDSQRRTAHGSLCTSSTDQTPRAARAQRAARPQARSGSGAPETRAQGGHRSPPSSTRSTRTMPQLASVSHLCPSAGTLAATRCAPHHGAPPTHASLRTPAAHTSGLLPLSFSTHTFLVPTVLVFAPLHTGTSVTTSTHLPRRTSDLQTSPTLRNSADSALLRVHSAPSCQ